MLKTISLALASAALLAAPAMAAEDLEIQTAGVTYTDLDLTTEAGLEELDRRIDSAAKQVCSYDDVTVGSRVRSRDARRCYRNAMQELEQHFAEVVADQRRGG